MMIVSRCVVLGRLSKNVVKSLLLQNGKSNVSGQIKRHSHNGKYYYRQPPAGPDPNEGTATVLGALVWWWFLWHLFTNYHELLPGSVPDPSKWTDEELGVPPLEE